MNSNSFEGYKIKKGHCNEIEDYDPNDTRYFPDGKEEGLIKLDEINEELCNLQQMLYAEHKHKVAIIFQAMDGGGKDGTINKGLKGFNVQGTRVVSIKKPTQEELDHDYLWRIHKQMPAKGEIVIFNRSHYEDVLVVRVNSLVPKEVWKKRYQHINDFERMLTDEGTTLLKIILNISKDEQKATLEERLKTPTKNWKFNVQDIEQRKLWDEYMVAMQDMIIQTSTDYAPWYIIPANKNWYRNLAVASITADTLKNLNMKYPLIKEEMKGITIP